MAVKELSSMYIAIGAGGVSFIALVWLLMHFVTKLNPTLVKINQNNLLHAEIVKNNTIAIGEISKSNQNVASAIKLLETTMAATMAMLDRHDKRAEEIDNKITSIRESTRNCSKK